MPMPVPGLDELVVDVACAVVDLQSLRLRSDAHVPEGAFVGRAHAGGVHTGAPESVVVGVGPIADHVCVPRAALRVFGACGEALDVLVLLPVMTALAAAFEAARLAFGERVCVSGDGMVARLAAQLTQVVTGRPAVMVSAIDGDSSGPADDLDADLIVDATADEAKWKAVLPMARERGRALLLLPGGPQVHPFDFYPTVHLKSLALVARRVPDAASWRSAPDATVEALRRLLGQRGLGADAAAVVRIPSRRLVEGTLAVEPRTTNGGLVIWFEAS
ncbi:MAG: hypothetical protein QN174_06560 [Armatimonadota bacterium]|nr:hypothetical protein [Armatimonadota bacterium]MDR7496601.1 hypothetical protein [Armatimonadota bacterium]